MGHRSSVALRSAGLVADGARRPLPRARWHRRLQDIARSCGLARADDEARLIREMHALLSRIPAPGLPQGVALPREAALEKRLQAGCCDSAALALLDGEAGYIVSRGIRGRYLASVVLAGDIEEVTATGQSLALAVVGALALALLQCHAVAEPPRAFAAI